jgi:hypothetical protein
MADLRRLPLSAFDPRLRDLLERGCREYMEIPCESHRQAQHLRNMLTMFRARMRREHPQETEKWEVLYGTIVSTKKGFPLIVTLRPRAKEFDDILDKLNLSPKAPPLEFDPLADFEPKAEGEEKNQNDAKKT